MLMIICRLKERYRGGEGSSSGKKEVSSPLLNSALAVQKRGVARCPQQLGRDNSN